MADRKEDKDAAKHSEEVAKRGFDEDALTDDQKAALEHEKAFEKDAEKAQEFGEDGPTPEQREQV